MSILARRSRASTTASMVDENGMVLRNPYYADVEFQIGDYNLSSLPPEHIMSFSCQRSTDSNSGEYNKFSLQIFDKTGIEIEYQITRGYTNCKFRYGYAGGDKSSLFQAEITNYNAEFTQGMFILNIEGISTGIFSMGKPKTTTYKNGKISDHVTKIAEEEGWKIGFIEDTKEVYDDAGNRKSYVRSNSDAVTFITNVLIPESKSESTGESGYLLYFEDKEEDTYVYFCTPNYKNDVSKAVGTDEQDLDEDEQSYNFTYNTDSKNTTVISFEPEFSGILTAVQGSNEIVASSVDPNSNQCYNVHIKGKVTTTSMTGENEEIQKTDEDYKTILNSSSCSEDELKNMALTMLYATASQSYPATLTIIGNPKIYPQRNCNIVVKVGDGVIHHSSGDYLITGVTDNISGGTYTTTLDLVRSGIDIEVEAVTTYESVGSSSGSHYNGNANNLGYQGNNGVNANNNGSINNNVDYSSLIGASHSNSNAVISNNSGSNGQLNSIYYANATKVGGSSNNNINSNRNKLSGAGSYNTDILLVASSELGYKEGTNNNTKYGSWYGLNNNPWCAMFVSWCANKAGISQDIIKKFASCDSGMQWFRDKGRFGYREEYVPMAGDIIFFGSKSDSTHTGIVEGVKNDRVYTIEGNSSDQVIRRNYAINDSSIIGYGSPNYAYLTNNINFNETTSLASNGYDTDGHPGGSNSGTGAPSPIGNYTDEDFRYLAAVISSEAYESSKDGMYGVGYVVLNRLNDSRFPNTIKEIVTAPGQFVSNWASYLTNPKKGAAKSAEEVLNGSANNPIGNCLFFLCASTTKRKGINVGGNLFFESW